MVLKLRFQQNGLFFCLIQTTKSSCLHSLLTTVVVSRKSFAEGKDFISLGDRDDMQDCTHEEANTRAVVDAGRKGDRKICVRTVDIDTIYMFVDVDLLDEWSPEKDC